MEKTNIKRAALEQTLHTLSPFLQRHSEMVAQYSELLAYAAMDAGVGRGTQLFRSGGVMHMRQCAYWHDVGKAVISNDLWELPRTLTDEEYVLVKAHPILGAAAVVGKIDPLSIPATGDPVLELAKDCCLYHHEHWDGTGYPFGLSREEIPLSGRIVAIADAYDSMTAQRPYTAPKTKEAALQELERCAGVQFDPELVPVFLKAMCSGRNLRYG